MDTGLRQYRSSCDLSQCGQWEQGQFRSRWYLGLSCGMEWLRLTVDGTADMRVRVYACDQPPEDFRDIEDTPSLERTAHDLLLYGVTGQYLSFTVEPGEALRGFALSFPGRSIAEGLPFILQEDNTLRALLAVCQSEYMDLTAQIRRFPERLNPAHPDALPQLSRWLGAQPWVGDRSAAQKILPYAPLLARMRGTRRGLQMLALLVTGYPCRVMEEYSRARYSTGAEEGLSILVPSCVARKAVQSLKRLLPDFIPVGISYSLIHLKDSAPMDGHSYEWALPHELGHYPQQALGMVKTTRYINGMPVDTSPDLERDANRRATATSVWQPRVVQSMAAMRTAQQPIQRLTEEEFNNLCAFYHYQCLGRKGDIEPAREMCHQILLNYWSFYHRNDGKKVDFDTYVNGLNYSDACQIIQGGHYISTGLPRKTVVTFGDQAEATARHAQKSGFRVIATAYHFDPNDPKTRERQKKIERTQFYDPEAVVTFQQPIALQDGGWAGDPTGQIPLELPDDLDRHTAIAAFDHPYTTGFSSKHGGADSEVKQLCRNFFEFASNNGIGRAQMTVRAVDRDHKSRLGPYELNPKGFAIYKIQRSHAKKHVKTNPKTDAFAIDPQQQSILIKYVNLEEMFPDLLKSTKALLGIIVVDSTNKDPRLWTTAAYRANAEEKDMRKLDDVREVLGKVRAFECEFKRAAFNKHAPIWLQDMRDMIFEPWYKERLSVVMFGTKKGRSELCSRVSAVRRVADMIFKKYSYKGFDNKKEYFGGTGDENIRKYAPHPLDVDFSDGE